MTPLFDQNHIVLSTEKLGFTLKTDEKTLQEIERINLEHFRASQAMFYFD